MCDNRCQRASTHHARKTADKPNKKEKKRRRSRDFDFCFRFTSITSHPSATAALPPGLPWIALRCCGLLPSLRLDIASSVWHLSGSQTEPDSVRLLPLRVTVRSPSWWDCGVCGLCPDSQRAVKAAFKFTLLSPQRAEGKRGHGREEAPPAPPTLTPPSPGNRLGRHGLVSLFKTFSSPSTSRGFACFTQL